MKSCKSMKGAIQQRTGPKGGKQWRCGNGPWKYGAPPAEKASLTRVKDAGHVGASHAEPKTLAEHRSNDDAKRFELAKKHGISSKEYERGMMKHHETHLARMNTENPSGSFKSDDERALYKHHMRGRDSHRANLN